MKWEKKFTAFIGSKESVVLHTIFFIVMFILPFFGIDTNTVLLVLTTVVSLEAIYLAIFIQMSVNENTESLHEVEEDIDEIQEDVDEIQEDIDEIQEDVDEIQMDASEDDDDLDNIENMLKKIVDEIERIKNTNK
jgi:peptidoglycan hydrolase CwlO-like protein